VGAVSYCISRIMIIVNSQWASCSIIIILCPALFRTPIFGTDARMISDDSGVEDSQFYSSRVVCLK
jgi:hypothetical protein